MAATTAAAPAAGSREAFLGVYETLKAELAGMLDPALTGLPAEVREWQMESLDYNVPGGKLNRGLSVVHALQALRAPAELTADEVRSASVLGWCIEWLQAFFLVADDIMDASPTRRGQPCWYKLPKVGMVAINDAFVLQSHLYKLLKAHFSGTPALYLQLVELFLETTWRTELGQQMDLTSSPTGAAPGTVDLERFTLARYEAIVKHKTAYYSFYLPIACGLCLAGLGGDARALADAEAICVAMGEYFQIQDDVLDAFAPPEVLGKVGTDIQDAKCSWLVVQALARADAPQRAALKAAYGRHEPEAVAAVKALYGTLGLQQVFAEYEESTYAALRKKIAETCAASGGRVPEEVFLALLHKIYKRSK